MMQVKSMPFFRTSIQRIKAEPGRRADRRLRRYIRRIGVYEGNVTHALQRTRDYQGRALEGRERSEVLYYEYRDHGSGLTADALFNLVDKGRRRQKDGRYKSNAGQLPTLGLFITLSFPRGMGLEDCKEKLGRFLGFLETRYSLASESVIHAKSGMADHAHIVAPDVAVSASGVSKKKVHELNGIAAKREGRGIVDGDRLLAPATEAMRAAWAEILSHGSEVVYDHRSYRRQGLDQRPLTRFSKQEIDRQKRQGDEVWRDIRREQKEYREQFEAEKREKEAFEEGPPICGPGLGPEPSSDQEELERLLADHERRMERVREFLQPLVKGLAERFMQSTREPDRIRPDISELAARRRSTKGNVRHERRLAALRVRTHLHPGASRERSLFSHAARSSISKRQTHRTGPSEVRVAVGLGFDVLHLLLRLWRRKQVRCRGEHWRGRPLPPWLSHPQSRVALVMSVSALAEAPTSEGLKQREIDRSDEEHKKEVRTATPMSAATPPAPQVATKTYASDQAVLRAALTAVANKRDADRQTNAYKPDSRAQLPSARRAFSLEGMDSVQAPTTSPLFIEEIARPKLPPVIKPPVAELSNTQNVSALVFRIASAWRHQHHWSQKATIACARHFDMSEADFDRHVTQWQARLFPSDVPKDPNKVKAEAMGLLSAQSAQPLIAIFDEVDRDYRYRKEASRQKRKPASQIRRRGRDDGPGL